MQNRSSLLLTTLTSISVISFAHESVAQSRGVPSPKAVTRLITLGTASGPSTRPDRAQSSNLRTVNGIVEDIGKMASRANVKTVVLSHLTQRVGTDDYTSWAEEVKKHFSGQVLAADALRSAANRLKT
jgi:hypothetical protein